MILAEEVRNNIGENFELRVFNKYGICELSSQCFSYTPNDNMCNVSRALAYRKQGLPRCYKPIEKG